MFIVQHACCMLFISQCRYTYFKVILTGGALFSDLWMTLHSPRANMIVNYYIHLKSIHIKLIYPYIFWSMHNRDRWASDLLSIFCLAFGYPEPGDVVTGTGSLATSFVFASGVWPHTGGSSYNSAHNLLDTSWFRSCSPYSGQRSPRR